MKTHAYLKELSDLLGEIPSSPKIEGELVKSNTTYGISIRDNYHCFKRDGVIANIRDIPSSIRGTLITMAETRLEEHKNTWRKFLEHTLEEEMPNLILNTLTTGEPLPGLEAAFEEMVKARVQKIADIIIPADRIRDWDLTITARIAEFRLSMDTSFEVSWHGCSEGIHWAYQVYRNMDSIMSAIIKANPLLQAWKDLIEILDAEIVEDVDEDDL